MRNNPIIALIDMDCFYVQVELNNNPAIKGKPSAVVQYNAWRGGSIIAVSYEARDKGVSRGMRGDEAKEKCPDIHLFSVPELRGKADLTRYRSAGAEVIKCLSIHASLVERASVDEAYIDLTDEVDNLLIAVPDHEDVQNFWQLEPEKIKGCHSIGFESYESWLSHVCQSREADEYCNDVRLALASYLVWKMREDVYRALGYRCSAGIAHSKIIAKYACGVHKPNQQTTVSSNHVATLLHNASIHKIRSLGGKLGKIVQERLNIDTMGQLARFSMTQLIESFGDRTGPWLFNVSRGMDDEGVISRQLAQSIGCSKTFPGASQLDTLDKVRHWIAQLAHEIVERVEQDRTNNARVPTHMCVTYRQLRSELGRGPKKSVSGSRVVPLGRLTIKDISDAALVVLAGINNAGHKNMSEQSWFPPLLELGLSAGKFRPHIAKNDISRYLIDAPMNNCPIINAKVGNTSLDIDSTSNSFSDENGLGEELIQKEKPTSSMSLDFQKIKKEKDETWRGKEADKSVIEYMVKAEVIEEQEEGSDIFEEVTPIKGFFTRRFEREEKERLQRSTTVSGFQITDVEMSSNIPELPRKETSFFAQRFAREKVEREQLESSRSEGTRSMSNVADSDYIKCDHCSQFILMWEAPEHFDYHLARQLQKDLNREVMDEEARKRRAALGARAQVAVSGSKPSVGVKRKAKDSTPTNQRRIDSFFAK